MPEAARVTDKTSHPGVLAPSGHPTVTYDGLPSTTLGDKHICTLHPPCNPITTGSPTVEIGGLPAARRGDLCDCGAIIVPPCSPTVEIGGVAAPYPLLASQNCYGWASGASAFRQPGDTSGMGWSSDPATLAGEMNAATVQKRLTDDLGAPMSNPDAAAPPGMHKAMFFTTPDYDAAHPNWDFHVYRQDSDGLWSHKPGGTPIRRFDSSCKSITDPRTATRLLNGGPTSYTQYIGTWLVPNH
jgi:uncharacterized Zn-binding protein involved in type VI secretion